MHGVLSLLVLPLVLSHTPQDPTWTVYSPADSSFSISLPESASESRFYSITPRGTLPTHSVSVETDRRAEFQISWTEYPSDKLVPKATPELFARARDALIDHKGGGVTLTDVDDSAPGQVGHRSTIRMANGRILELRFILSHHRFYQLTAETDDTPAGRAWAARFLKSFAPSGVVRI